MKQSKKGLRHLLPGLWLMSTALCGLAGNTAAQTIFKDGGPGSDPFYLGTAPEITLATGVIYTDWINCDAYTEFSSSATARGHVLAIAWDEFTGPIALLPGVPIPYYITPDQARFSVIAPSGSTVISLPSGTRHPDIVIGDDTRPGAKQGDCIINVVYEWGTDVYLSQYSITHYSYMGVTPFAVTNIMSGMAMETKLSASSGKSPHIDMYHDTATYSISPYTGVWGLGRDWNNFIDQPLSKFCIVWSDAGQVMSVSGNNKDAGSVSPVSPAALAGLGVGPDVVADVACQVNTDTNSVNYGEATAYVAFYDGANAVMLNNWNPDLQTAGVSTNVYLPSRIKSPPRIEAMNNDNFTYSGSDIRWEMVFGDSNAISLTGKDADIIRVQGYGTPLMIDVAQYSMYSGLGNPYFPSSPPNQANNAYYPVVAAGCGPNQSTYLDYGGNASGANDRHLKAYQIVDSAYASLTPAIGPGNSYDFYLAQEQTITGGVPGSGYMTINATPLVGNPDFRPKLALGCASNSGGEMLAAWNDGKGNLRYEFVNGPHMFKTSPLDNKPAQRAISIAPNPADYELTVSGISTTAVYTIRDISGKLLLKGHTGTGGKINIQSLATGNYLLQLNEQGKISSRKFTKQ